jgi:nicotinamidase-related amidase
VSADPHTLSPDRTALIVIDLQEKLLPAIDGHEGLVVQVRTLLRLASALELPVVLTTQYRKGLGPIVPEILELAGDVEPIDKVAFGCFGSPEFGERLRDTGRDQLLVSGVEAHICVTQSVLGAVAAGFTPHVVTDATGSRSEVNRQLGFRRMERAGAWLSSTEMAAYELLGRADNAAFKQMLPYFR